MATVLTTTELADVLKELYPDGLDESLIYKDHPLMGLMTHKRNFGGRQMHVPIRYGKPTSRSHTFANAQSNAYTSLYQGFDVTRVSDYGIANISGESVDLAKTGDESIFLDDLQAEMDGALSTMGDNLAKEMYRSSSGSRGQVGSVSTVTITLKNIEDVYFFEVGMVLRANDTDNSTSMRTGTNAITAIDEDAGTLTGSDWTVAISGITTDDYLFVDGDQGAAMSGLAAWVPATAPTSGDSFFSVDRSVSTRLSGIRFSGSTYDHAEFFIRAKARVSRSPSKPDYWFMNPKDVANFETAAHGQREYIVSTEYNIGFESIRAYGVKIIPDPDCPVGVTWGIPMDCWWWATLGDAPRVINEDGLEMIRSSTADQYEIRVVSRGNCMSDAPGLIVRGALPT